MKPVTNYKCDICGSVFTTQKQALNCEDKHKIIKRIVPLFEANHVMPSAIRVYYLDDSSSSKEKQRTYNITPTSYSYYQYD